MDELTIKAEHKRQIVAALRLAVDKAAGMCPKVGSMAELKLRSAMEGLHRLERLNSWVTQKDYIETLMLCEYGVGGEIDRENDTDPREGSEAGMHAFLEASVLPLIQEAYAG